MHGFKSAILAKMKNSQNGNKKFFSYHDPGSAKSRIYAGKSTLRGFSKKALTEIEIFFCFRFELIPRRPGTLN